MKNKAPILLLLSFALLAGSAFCQQTLKGKVVDVIDGKTVVIEISTGKLIGVLEYLEIPEPEQPLNRAVREHLKELVLGKNVDFLAMGISPGKTFGQLFLNGVDVGQQLVRDGAAWHIPSQRSGQGTDEGDQYEKMQALAKTEKRGIWLINGMKPAWEFRAEKAENERRAEEAKWQRTSITNRNDNGRAAAPDRPMPNSNGSINNAGALINRYDAKSKTGSLETPMLPSQDLTNLGRKMACSVGYYYHEDASKTRKGKFVLFMAWIDTPRMSSTTSLIMKVDGKSIGTAQGKRTKQSAGTSTVETLAFEMSREQVEKVANGSDVGLWLDKEVLIPGAGFTMLLYNLLEASK
jgi:endonuclease YncB( thermonuclease family)